MPNKFDGLIGHYHKDHRHIEFRDWNVNAPGKKVSTGVGYIMTVNTILAGILIFVDIYSLNTMNASYNKSKTEFITKYASVDQTTAEFTTAYNRI